MDENYEKTKSNWSRWIVAGILIVVAVIVARPSFKPARILAANNCCVCNLRQIDAAKQQWALENNKTNLETVVTWNDVRLYLGTGSKDSPDPFYCPQDKTKQFSNSYILGDLKSPPKCKINPVVHFLY